MVQLGDIIDGCNSKLKESEKALKAVLEVLSKSVVPRYDLIGNHELYNLHRPELEKCGLRCGPSGGSSAQILDVLKKPGISQTRAFDRPSHSIMIYIHMNTYDTYVYIYIKIYTPYITHSI